MTDINEIQKIIRKYFFENVYFNKLKKNKKWLFLNVEAQKT